MTQLIEKLQSGQRVYLSGLETNPVLMRQLETLLCDPPYLWFFGEKKTFPQMNLALVWPEGRKMASNVWKQYLNQCAPPKEEDDLPESMEQEPPAPWVGELHDALDRLTTLIPGQPSVLDTQALREKVAIQVRIEHSLDGIQDSLPQPHHLRKAINSVFSQGIPWF